jgi:hypothetical protein
VQINFMDLHFEITKEQLIKLAIKAVLFLAIAVFLIYLAFSGGRTTLSTSVETCTQNAIAAGVEPVGCDGP